jgi:aminomethyltransferase
MLIDSDKMTDGGDEVWADGKKVGVITCPSYSKLTKRSMAIARLDVAHAKQGAKLEVRGKNVKASAIAHTITFDDPEKKKRTAVG